MKRKHLSFFALILGIALVTGCSASSPDTSGGTVETTLTTDTADTSPAATTDDASEEDTDLQTSPMRSIKDMSGQEVTVPAEVNSIISLAPSTTQLLIDLGLSEKIVATDTYSAFDFADDLPQGIPAFDMMNPDNEQIVSLNADLVFTTGMSYAWGEDVFASARDAGVIIIDIESPASLQGIADSIRFIGDCAGETEEAEWFASAMEDFVAEVKEVLESSSVTGKSVLYEMSTPTADYPTIYSVGPDSYIDEIITLCGGLNVAHDAEAPWVSLTEEAAVSYNPEVILTADDYTPDVVNVLLSLSGWEQVSAVQNREVYQIDSNAVSRPNHHVCDAILEIGLILHPGVFEALENPFAEIALQNAA